MLKRLLAWLEPQSNIVYRIVELPEQRTHLSGGDAETRSSIATLSSHPGFVALLNRLAVQNAALKGRLDHSFHKDLREVDILQAGVFWSNWLRSELERATVGAPQGRQVDPMEEELAAFRAIDAQIERVGEGE